MPDSLPIGTETLVLIVGVLLYLTDLAHLLYANEIVLVGSRGGPWSVTRPANGFRMSRRAVVLPRLYDPAVADIRLVLPANPGASRGRDVRSRVDSRLQMLRTPAWISRLLLVEIFFGIPIAYFQPERGWPLLVVFGLVYGQVLYLSAWLLAKRRALGLDAKPCAILIFESVICIPYAINFHRKLARQTITALEIGGSDLAAGLLPEEAVRGIEKDAQRFRQADDRQEPAAGASE